MFSEFNARSAFSFLHGASLPEDLVARAAELGYESIAITDALGFQGSARVHAAAREHGIRAHVGTLFPWSPGPAGSMDDGRSPMAHVPLLAATRSGYARLCQHLTTHLQRDPADRGGLPTRREATHSLTGSPTQTAATADHSSLVTRHFPPINFDRGSVVCLTGDHDAALARLILAGEWDQALAHARSLIDAFGRDNVQVQIVRHHARHEARLNRRLVELARHLGLPLLASNAPLHATRGDRLLCDAFACLRHHTTLDRAGALLAPNGERHLKSPRRLRELFADLPEAVDNTLRLAGRLEFTLEDLGYRFPDARDDHGQPLSLGEQATRLRRLTYAGAHRRYGRLRRKVKHQLEHELALIARLGFPGYFLIVEEIMSFAKAHGIFCQGRGSAANSAVCYALGITNVDPVGGGLLFERFLSENRRSWPDIDIDFPSGARRELVIQHVFEKYGPRGTAMTANVITYRPRSAFREMSKVLGFPPSIADRFSDICSAPKVHDEPTPSTIHHPPSPAGGMDDYYPRSQVAELEATIAKAGIPPTHPRLPALMHLYHAVLAMPRHLGQHSGGMIICDRGLDSIVPLQPATMPGRTIVQWDKDDCEDLGLVKVDLLGLGMLAAVEDALKICADRGHPVDAARLPMDDPAVYDLLCRADTIGTFQVESRAQMATLPIMKPRSFYDLAIEVAIIRPGPIVGDLLHPYLNRRNGREKVDHIHPDLEPILARTLGVPLFQEQVLRMAMTLADFDGAEADQLRRAMAFKRSDEKMLAVTARLRERMTARGIPAATQQKVVQSIGSFALYGFPESHAISFALIAYLSCWMKVHRPAEFYCGLINNQPMGFYSVNTLLEDARRHGVRARPVSVAASEVATVVLDDRRLRLGLHRLKGLSRRCAERLVEERNQRPFDSLPDFLRRVRPSARERRLLAASGALNPLPEVEHRRHALWQAELPFPEEDELWSAGLQPAPPRREAPQETTSHSSLFTQNSAEGGILPPMSDAERLAADFLHTGATTGPHPMALWRQKLKTENLILANSHRARDLHELRHGSPVAVGGMVICRQRPGTAKGHCFISLEDETGIANLFVPRDTFHHHKLTITTEAFLLAEGTLQISEGNQPTVYTTALHPLPGIDAEHAAGSHDFH